jgi:hypothetical protein
VDRQGHPAQHDKQPTKSPPEVGKSSQPERTPRRASLFLRDLYKGLRDKCQKFYKYVIAKSKSEGWQEVAHKFDWQHAELDKLMKCFSGTVGELDHAAKSILEDLVFLSTKIDIIVRDLEVFISAIDYSADILLNNKDFEKVEVLDTEDVAIEQEVSWLLHRWIQTTEEVKQISRMIATVREQFDDFVFGQAMNEIMRNE